MTSYAASAVSLILVISGINTDTQSVCTNLRSVQESICSGQNPNRAIATAQGKPGKKGNDGQKGDVGEKGSRGAPGPPGNVDHERIEAMIEQKLREDLMTHAKNISQLTTALNEATKKIEKLESHKFCPVLYEGKCFWFKYRSDRVKYEKVQSICKGRGWKMANIYSKEHYDMIAHYMRTFIEEDERINIHGILGMTYNEQAGTVQLRDGTTAPYVKWYPGYPVKGNGQKLGMDIKFPLKHSHQGMFNENPNRTRLGVLCET